MNYTVRLFVTADTQRDEIFFDVEAPPTSELQMVNFQIFHAPAVLASPTVAFENLTSQFLVGAWIQ